MGVVGVAQVECPGCGRTQDVTLVQSINTRTDAPVKQQLLAGELNVLACACGRTTQLAANMLFHDPDADYYVRVVPDEAAIPEAASLFRAAGATGRQRVVPTPNALVEKLKILDAGLEDWAIELLKVLLLATVGDLDRVFLFDRIDRETGLVHWVLFDEGARTARTLESPIAGYDRLIATAKPPRADELQVDRAWAVTAAQALIVAAN